MIRPGLGSNEDHYGSLRTLTLELRLLYHIVIGHHTAIQTLLQGLLAIVAPKKHGNICIQVLAEEEAWEAAKP